MIFRCKKHAKNILPHEIKVELNQFKYVFNPSFIIHNETEYWAFRCYYEHKKEILCNLYLLNRTTRKLTIIELNPFFRQKYDVRPADPKLFLIKNKVYCTLNSGYVNSGENNIYIFPVVSSQLEVKRCIINKRNRIEKNWAFFYQDGKIKMLYAVTPICKIFSYEDEDNKAIYFKLENESSNNLPEFSIGTQLLISNNDAYLISHKKITWKGKRLYLGVPIKINLKTLEVHVSSQNIIHSFKSMLGDKFKFNKNLISCTYFSGLQIDFDKNKVNITYGINDVAWGSSELKINSLWQ